MLPELTLGETYEVNYWCKRFGVSKAELTSAVKAVGTSAEKVRKYLGK